MTKIMVVDDEEDIVTLVGEMLRREGYQVVGCSSGRECLEKIEKVMPDLVLMDIMMPPPDGMEATSKIKKNPRTKHIPVAMFTVKFEKKDKIKSFQESKCDAYIVKPVNRRELIKVVRWLTEGKK